MQIIQENNDIDRMLPEIIDDYIARDRSKLTGLRRGTVTRDAFMRDARERLGDMYSLEGSDADSLLRELDRHVFGYSCLTPLH